MWKCISGVSKVVKEKKNEKAPKAACDMKEYEKTRIKKFSTKWQVGWPWLKYDEEKGIICEWCVENKQTLVAQNVLNSTRFIDGCTSNKTELISYHEKSAGHLLAKQCHKGNLQPEKNPPNLAHQQLLKQYTSKLRLLFRNVHTVSKNKKSLADY